MIYTLTTNPAIDMNFDTTTFEPSKVNRTSNLSYSPNGKGVNVSVTLKHFNVNSVVLGFFGGFSGKYIVDELRNSDIDVRPCWIEENTRINSFISCGGSEYKFVNSGPTVNQEVQYELLDEIKNSIDCDILAISGSLPPSINETYYDDILSCCNENNIEFILDISSKKLIDLLKYKPLLIKPNDEEIKDIFGITLTDENSIKNMLEFLHEEGAQNILLTLGEKGLYFYNGKEMFYCSSQKVELVSSACAGDACLGAFLSEWLIDKNNIEISLKKASAVGADVANSYGLGNFGNYKNYINNLYVRGVKL